MGHLVVCAAQLEAEDGLQVFPLEQHIAFEPVAQIGREGEGCFLDDFVDARREDEAEIVGVAVGEEERVGYDIVGS